MTRRLLVVLQCVYASDCDLLCFVLLILFFDMVSRYGAVCLFQFGELMLPKCKDTRLQNLFVRIVKQLYSI
jgi:hypothetical protein